MTDVGFITGAATGIGAATARALADNGVRVAVCDVNEAAGTALAEAINGRFIPCDVTQYESVAGALDDCISSLGVPRYAHLNAGIMTVPTGDDFLAIEDVSIEQYRRILGVNLDGVFYGVKCLLPAMRDGGGAITVTASVAAFGMLPIDPLYSATKHALVGFIRSIAQANRGGSVRLNVICPGVVDTAIVPDSFRDPATIMSPDVLAAEVVDLLLRGENGEVRAKISGRDAIIVPPIDVNSI